MTPNLDSREYLGDDVVDLYRGRDLADLAIRRFWEKQEKVEGWAHEPVGAPGCLFEYRMTPYGKARRIVMIVGPPYEPPKPLTAEERIQKAEAEHTKWFTLTVGVPAHKCDPTDFLACRMLRALKEGE